MNNQSLIDRSPVGLAYFETSALNALAEETTPAAANIVRIALAAGGFDVRFSPTLFWEILLTRNEAQREKLIYFCQMFRSGPLLPAPEELIIEYLRQGCPLEESRRELVSKSSLAEAWEDLRNDDRRTFIVSRDSIFKRVEACRGLSRTLREILSGRPISSETLGGSLSTTLNFIANHLGSEQEESIDARRRLIIGGFFVLSMVCFGLTMEETQVSKYWAELGIEDPNERLRYLLHEREEVFYRGPVAVMIKMAELQYSLKYSRGIWMDCQHAAYLPYVDRLISNDLHFEQIIDSHSVLKRIIPYRNLTALVQEVQMNLKNSSD